MDLKNNQKIQEENIIINSEDQIKNNYFSDKEELFNYLVALRTNGEHLLDSKKICELLDLFDNVNNEKEEIHIVNKPTKNKSKIRTKVKPFYGNTDNAAFTKVGLLIINIITFALLVTTIILLKKIKY